MALNKVAIYAEGRAPVLYTVTLQATFCNMNSAIWAVKGKFLKQRNFCLSMLLFEVVFTCFHGERCNF